MYRALLAVVITATLASSQPPKDGKPALYFPTTKGDTWVMEVKVGERVIVVIETVAKVEVKDGVYTVTVESVDDAGGKKPRETVYEVSEKGVTRTSNREKEGGPLPLVKVGAKEGEQWVVDRAGPGGVIGKATYTVGKTEEVTVPAGKYQALRIDVEFKLPMRTTKMTQWFAPGVGSVKFESATGETKQTTVLKSFTPGSK